MTGGRDVSAESGADRIELWADGLRMVKAHLFFGVGFNNFQDFASNTAHNSVVICAAELGLFGLICWIALIFITFRSGLMLSREDKNKGEAEQETDAHAGGPAWLTAGAMPVQVAQYAPWKQHREIKVLEQQVAASPAAERSLRGIYERQAASLENSELRRLTRLLTYALVGFLTAGWFLSRAYSLWLFILCGMMHVLVQMGNANGIPERRDRLGYILRWSAIISVGLLSVISIIIRITGGH